MSSTFTVLVALLMVAVCRSSAEPEEVAEAHHSLGESDEMSEVTTPPKLVLEDPASWSASTEVEDEKHAWYRRRRDAEVVDLEVAESHRTSDLTEGKKITVTVFYECLCPDSKRFIIDHLLPSYEKAPHLIKLELVPYGKAETSSVGDTYEFSCQHGSAECLGNKVHSCVIHKVDDEMKTLKLISCLLDESVNIESSGPQCAKKYDIPWGPIFECAKSKEGSRLLKEHGDSTAALSPQISFVPTILLNQKRDGQPAILKNLWKEICRVLPEATPECN